MIISMQKKTFKKIQHPFMIKTFGKLGMKENLSLYKSMYKDFYKDYLQDYNLLKTI